MTAKPLLTFEEFCNGPWTFTEKCDFVDRLTEQEREQIIATAPEYLRSKTEEELLTELDDCLNRMIEIVGRQNQQRIQENK